MKKSILLVCGFLCILFSNCKKTPSEFLVSEIQTLNELTNPAAQEQYVVNKQVTFYV